MKEKSFFKKALEIIFQRFWLVFGVAIAVSLLDLIAITQNDVGLGFILTFLYFIGWLIYNSDNQL